MPDQSPRTIATINFKGGVGKTTVTWCLGDVLSSLSNERVLMFDLDAQMSLTQAIALNEATGNLDDKFGAWYKTAIERKKTIFDALEAFTRPRAQFDFGVGFDFIYQISKDRAASTTEELGAVKELLREVSRQLARLEVRVKRAFPLTYPGAQSGSQSGGPSSHPAATISSEEALRIYEELVQRARTGARDDVQARLASMGLQDLELMRRELGISLGSKKPGRKLLVSAIQARINESLLMGQHADRRRLVSEASEGNSPDEDGEVSGPG